MYNRSLSIFLLFFIFLYGEETENNLYTQAAQGSFGVKNASRLTRNLVGLWTFDDPDSLTAAEIGNALELVGTHQPAEGPADEDGAVTIGTGSYYRCYHDIPPNGSGGDNPQWVNRFSLVIDFRIPAGGQWYSFYQTNWSNSNDADAFVSPTNTIGVGDTGYSDYQIIPGEWYRLVISCDLGIHYDYYLDGQFLHAGGAQAFEGRFALYSSNDQNMVLFFADNNGEDNAFDIARVALYDTDLTASETAVLGGFGHDIPSPENAEMKPYLQSPTPNSMYICWHSALSTESLVNYGLTESLGQQGSGTTQILDGQTYWHTVQLSGLQPDTEYFYQCVTDSASSPVSSFRTPPENNYEGHIRFAVYGDSRTDVAAHTMVIEAMREKITELYGVDYQNNFNLIFNVGDIVTNGWTLPQYRNEHFNPTSSLTKYLPYMISIGNHEGEAPYYYDYMKYEDFGGSEGEKYYAFRIGPVLFIALNSNIQGNTQISWLEDELTAADDDESLQWIFAFDHHPGHSEVWPDGNTAWVQEQVIPLLNQHDKAELLAYGHSHNYERGATAEGSLRLMLSGGGGSALDRWGMYGNQQDYPEITRSFDHYSYTLIDVDIAGNSYTAETYSLGNTDLPLDNVLIDSFFRDRDLQPPQTPEALTPQILTPEPVVLTASAFAGDADLMSSQFQVTGEAGSWDSPLVDQLRDWENVYGDTGAPDYLPIDLNEGIDLSRYEVETGILATGESYRWRVRYRDQNLAWSEWSAESSFQLVDAASLGDLDQNDTVNILDVILMINIILGQTEPSQYQAWAGDLNADGNIDVMDIVLVVNMILNLP
ncbi:MAG: hypothetical protein GXO91_09200 [FCB group bacterium]|nr:hypothetical protein [FCB group bacterium]